MRTNFNYPHNAITICSICFTTTNAFSNELLVVTYKIRLYLHSVEALLFQCQ